MSTGRYGLSFSAVVMGSLVLSAVNYMSCTTEPTNAIALL